MSIAPAGADRINIGKLALGTVQFGMAYGLTNTVGHVPFESAKQILDHARQLGIAVFDTAHAYGNAEQVLGDVLDGDDDLRIVTKTLAGTPAATTSREAEQVQTEFRQSLSRLKRRSVYGLLVHDVDIILRPGAERIWADLQRLRSEKATAKIGVSVYDPGELERLLDRYPDIDLVQLPLNIYDRRFALTGLLDELKRRNIEVHARSPFLQGLLLIPPDDLPPRFARIQGHHRTLHEWIATHGVTPVTVALGVCLADRRVDFIVVGCERIEQLDEIAAARQTKWSIDADQFAVSDEEIIKPSRWRSN